MLITTGRIRTWLGILSTIVGVGFVGYQYFDNKWKSRIERSLNYVLIYQESSKVAARNEIHLRSYNEPDPAVLEALKRVEGISHSECVEKRVSAVAAVLQPGAAAKTIEGLKNVGETFCKSEFTKNVVSQLDGLSNELPSVMKCREHVYNFANKKLNDEGGATKAPTTLSVNEWVEIGGRIVQKGEDGRLWWIEKGSYYYYSWTDIMWKFFHSPEQKNLQQVEECYQFLRDYEYVLDTRSGDILKSLHELKHFYAAMSICTTSQLCDSFVACDAFNSDVGNFVANWQQYFELWSAKERESEYHRLQAFIGHCNSNSEFLEYSITQRKSGMLEVQGFLNMW